MKANDRVNLTPQFHLFTKSQIRDIHLATLHVLDETGVRVEEEAVELLRDAGARTEGDGVVQFPSHLVEEAIRSAPKSVTLYHRDRKGKMAVEGYQVYFRTGAGCPFTYDLDTNQRRRTKKKDTEDFAVLADLLPNIDFVMSMGNCNDFPSEVCHRHEFEAMVTHTTKPICFTGGKWRIPREFMRPRPS